MEKREKKRAKKMVRLHEGLKRERPLINHIKRSSSFLQPPVGRKENNTRQRRRKREERRMDCRKN